MIGANADGGAMSETVIQPTYLEDNPLTLGDSTQIVLVASTRSAIEPE